MTEDRTALLGLFDVPLVGVPASRRRRIVRAFREGLGPDPYAALRFEGVPIRESAFADVPRQGRRDVFSVRRHDRREDEARLRGDESELYMSEGGEDEGEDEDEQERHPWEDEGEFEAEDAEAHVLHYLTGARDALKTLAAGEDEAGVLSHAHRAVDAALTHLQHRRAWRSDSPMAARSATSRMHEQMLESRCGVGGCYYAF